MFCGNCGTQNPDNAPFCAGCGAKLNEAPVAPAAPETDFAPVRRPAPKSKKGLLVGILSAVVAIAVALVLIFCISTPKGAAKKLCKAIEKGNAKTIMKLLPKQVKEEAFGDKDDQKEAQEELQEMLDEMLEELEDYDVEFELSVSKVEKVDKDDLEDIQETYEDAFDCKVKDAKEVTVKIAINEDGDKDTEKVSIYVIKVGMKWYVDYMSLAEVLSYFY